MVHYIQRRELKTKERKQCCCCGAKIWTIFMACLQIIMYILQLAGIALLYTGVVRRSAKPRSPDEEGGAMALVAIGGFFSILGIIAAIIFIKGAIQSNIKYLTIGMVFAALCFTWKVVELGLEVGVSGGNIMVTFISISVIAVVYTFSFWAVNVLKKDIRAGLWIGGVHFPRAHSPHVIVTSKS